MSEIAEYMQRLKLPEGFSDSRLDGVRFFKQIQQIPKMPLLYDPGIIIVIQGHKIGYLGDRSFQYDENNYLVVPVFIHFECETFATTDRPLLGIYIDINMAQLHELISHIGPTGAPAVAKSGKSPVGIGPALMDDEMAGAIFRLLRCLQSKTEAQILGSGLVREILFRALCGAQAPMLYALAKHDGHFSRIARTLRMIQSEYQKKLM